MIDDISKITCCIVDHGLFLPVAHRMAEACKRVLYHVPSEEGFPTINRCIIGDGFDDIEKCDDIWAVKNEVDLFCFPDIGFSGLQLELESQGKLVWGSRRADSLEIYRRKFHRVLEETGLPVPTFTVVQGLNKLREHLKGVEDKYIKISRYRGSLETTHWRSWSLDEGLIDILAVRFGPAKELIPFLVFDAIETDLELGSDTYTVDGQWPSVMLHGLEHKDKGYIGAVTKRSDLPSQLNDVLDAFGPVLKQYRCRNQWSTEVRVKDGVGYFTDPTPRGGIPSTPSQSKLWKNFPEIVLAGAQGELLEPEYDFLFSAECMITGKSSKEQWPAVEIPDELKEWTAFGNCCEIDGRLVFPVDDSHDNDLGWLTAVGNTLQETIENLKDHADLLPPGLDADTDSMVDLLAEALKAEKEGIQFTSQRVPDPVTAVSVD